MRELIKELILVDRVLVDRGRFLSVFFIVMVLFFSGALMFLDVRDGFAFLNFLKKEEERKEERKDPVVERFNNEMNKVVKEYEGDKEEI